MLRKMTVKFLKRFYCILKVEKLVGVLMHSFNKCAPDTVLKWYEEFVAMKVMGRRSGR